jgi:hypothetical protein
MAAATANASDAPMITPGTPISTPTLIDIDKRWLDLTAQQQLDIFKALHEREKEPWYTMTTEERKACKLPSFPMYDLSTIVDMTGCVIVLANIGDGLTDG